MAPVHDPANGTGSGGEEAPEDTFAALLRHQSRELDRLARENERLMDRIETLLQLQEREQVLRQQLQTRIDRLNEQLSLPGPAGEREAMCRQIRDGLSEELRPVLIAIVELLELALGASGVSREAAGPNSSELLAAEGGKLPEILLRPIEDLIGRKGGRPPSDEPRVGAGDSERTPPAHQAPPADEAAGRAQPNPRGAAPWTTVIS